MVSSCTEHQESLPSPKITAQGFSLDETQEGVLGKYQSIRVRIETTGHIQKLVIKERSYEIDLATTPERDHYPLFGIDKKALLHTDVTLDFQNYINRKLTEPGEYTFVIAVTDRKNQAATKILLVRVVAPKEESTRRPVETGRFHLKREGRSLVQGGDTFGIAWKTFDEIKVAIRVSKAEGGAKKLARFNREDYAQVVTRGDLDAKIKQASDVDYIEFDTANGAASGKVFGVARLGKYYILRTDRSATSLSSIGTTVMISGEYKYY
ncbi:MAG: hypothetical protein OEY67_07350 [Gammaproteobacteria bacterium]|nr:hypothetical protein [Gammaproteobacteria bacterium]